jgi:hypothetical protein
MYEDVSCCHGAVFDITWDSTMRKLFSIYIYVPCFTYTVKMFRSPYFKWLVKVFWCMASQILVQCMMFISLIFPSFDVVFAERHE